MTSSEVGECRPMAGVIEREQWLVYGSPEYRACPWPYDARWEGFLSSPPPLRFASDAVACASPCDGLTETPSVPPNLPRLAPRGRYRAAVHHDADWIYVLFDFEDPPAVADPAELRAAPQLAGMALENVAVSIFTDDLRFCYVLDTDPAGEPRAFRKANVYGPRRAEPPAWAPEWDFRIVPAGAARRACWRIVRRSLADAIRGDALRLSISRLSFPSVEGVAWGSLHVWAPRHDEAMLVRLVSGRERAPWPELSRVDLHYAPDREHGSFTLRWEGVYEPGERFEGPSSKGFPHRPVHLHSVAVRVNGLCLTLPLEETVRTPDVPLADGQNLIEISSAGGPAVRLCVEKRSGTRIELPAGLPDAGYRFSAGEAVARIRRECDAMLEATLARRSRGEPLEYMPWSTYHAASCGVAARELLGDERYLEVVREHADAALALQRPDGTFAGFHLRIGRPSHVPWAGGAYDSGPAGELWATAAALLGDAKYLEASRRLLRAYRTYRVEFNHNYAAFTLYHLAAHYRLTGERAALDEGLYYARTSAAAAILPLGFQAGHNYYSCYGGITLRGLARFCAVLPSGEPWREALRERCVRMANQMTWRLQADGLHDGRDRYYIGERNWFQGIFAVAFLLEGEQRRRLDAVLARMLEGILSPGAEGVPARVCDSDVVRYLVSRERLLGGALGREA